MRLFAAIAIPEDVRAAVEPRLPEAVEGLRRIPAERWHLTLAFYGDASEAGAACLEEGLQRRLAAAGAPRLLVRGGGRFATVAFLSVVGAAPRDDANLRGLARGCHRAGASCGLPDTSGPFRFRAHITVARSRGGGIPPAFVQGLEPIESSGWVADRVQLVTSVLGPEPRYGVRRTFPVAAP